MGRSRGGRNRSGRRTNGAAMKLIALVVCALFTVLLILGINLRRRIRYNDMVRENLTEQMREEESRREGIQAEKEYMETDEYVREVARDYLGLVDESDVILKEKSEP